MLFVIGLPIVDLVKKINVHLGLHFNLRTRSKGTLDFRVIG